MSTSNTCRHITLAKNGVAHVQRCSDCGCNSIHLGPLTFRLDDAGLEALCFALGEATAVLAARRAAHPLRHPRGLA